MRRQGFVAGNPVALGVSAVVAVSWTVRVLVRSTTWSEGVLYVVGHALLASLFPARVAIYAGTVAFHPVW